MIQKTKRPLTGRILFGSSMVALTFALGASVGAQAQVATTKNDTGASTSNDSQVVVITGYRASLQSALKAKRNSGVELDAINSDDIASFPEANLAESLQRIPGISIDRDNGEGRQISVRGLGGDFTRVRIDGMEALSTGAANDSGTSPNRSRAFDFNAFASELFSGAQVRKTQDGQTDEGSLGATVDLNTAHPFDYKGTKFAFAAEDAYYQNGNHQNPRLSGLYSTRWDGGKMGFLISGAYQTRDTSISSYARSIGSFDYDYRGTSFPGAGLNSAGGAVTANQEYPQYAGFAAPTGTTFNQVVLTAAGPCPNTTTPSQPIGTICNYGAITNPDVIAAETGSDPTAYALVNGPDANGRYDASQVRIPALATLNDSEVHTSRVGITSSFQFQPDENTKFTTDFLYTRFRSGTQNFQIQSVGLNRNNTSNTFDSITPANQAAVTIATKRGLYPSLCTAAAGGGTVIPVDCGGSLYGTTPAYATGSDGKPSVLGVNIFSTDPYNLDTYDYYNNPNSPGYAPNAEGLNGRVALIGRPATKLLAAHVTNGIADYLQMSNVDWRSADDASFYTTKFNQLSLNMDHRFNDAFKMVANIGASDSVNVNQGLLVEFDSMDRPETFTYDERGSPKMPVMNPGWDVANPNNWSIVKGFSAMRQYIRTTKNTFDQAKVDFDWVPDRTYEVRFGASAKNYEFSTNQYERNTDTLNPTDKEAGVTIASLGKVHEFGQGLDVSPGTPTSFFAPDLTAFSKAFGYDCNCINKFGDFRLTNLRSPSAQFGVTEKDFGSYAQVDFNYEIFGRELTGNLGVRDADTKIAATGLTSVNLPVQETNHYNDVLPALNINYHVMDNLYMRLAASKAMARPLLGNLNPGVGKPSVPNTAGATTGGSITVGNTQLKPFRSTNYDFAAEWYFAKNSLLSFAAFDKEVISFPQTVLYSAPLSQFLNNSDIAAVEQQFTGSAAQIQNQIDYVNNGQLFDARQVRDAPGGSLWGWEISYQTDLGYLPDHFKFIPDFVKNFGIQLNATHIDSKLTYILDPGVKVNGVQTTPQTFGYGPWLNASPDALNFTLYYQVPQFDARVSVSQRAAYYTSYPIAAGSCSPGLSNPTNTTNAATIYASTVACDSPLINDFAGSKGTLNVDGVFNWNFSQHLTVRLEGLNLTNQTSNRTEFVANPVVTSYASSGRQITVGVRYKY